MSYNNDNYNDLVIMIINNLLINNNNDLNVVLLRQIKH